MSSDPGEAGPVLSRGRPQDSPPMSVMMMVQLFGNPAWVEFAEIIKYLLSRPIK